MTDQPYLTEETGAWRYELPVRTDAKVFLLTIGRIAVVGNWYGEYGQFFIAWAPMPKRNKSLEMGIGLLLAAPVDHDDEPWWASKGY